LSPFLSGRRGPRYSEAGRAKERSGLSGRADPGADALGAATVEVDSVPRTTRWLVRCFLVAFVACGLFGLEVWPLTGFTFFSRLRTDTRIIWVADTVGPSNHETPLWFTDLPRAYQGFGLIMRGFAKLSPTARAATCQSWLAEARRVRSPVNAIRIYRVTWRALPRVGEGPAPPPSRVLTYACG
jgi:hypothetical protein